MPTTLLLLPISKLLRIILKSIILTHLVLFSIPWFKFGLLPFLAKKLGYKANDVKDRRKQWIMYGSTLSPFALKVEAALKMQNPSVNVEWNFNSSWLNYFIAEVTVIMLRSGSFVATQTLMENPPSKYGELPLVPYLIPQNNYFTLDNPCKVIYDSSFIVNTFINNNNSPDDKSLIFMIHLIDEYFDEWGLYLVHHRRWVDEGNHNPPDNRPGQTLAHKEVFKGQLPRFFSNRGAEFFNHRQTRRLAYLFSIAPPHQSPRAEGYPIPYCCNSSKQQPPSPHDEECCWPETWTLLNESWIKLLKALDPILKTRSTLFGGSLLTSADFSMFGQLDMLARRDQASRKEMIQEAPNVVKWLDNIRETNAQSTTTTTNNNYHDLYPFITEIRETFIPLMKQNKINYEKAIQNGCTIFNEDGFWIQNTAGVKNKALYDGIIRQYPFRSVVKTFQVEVWNKLLVEYNSLSRNNKFELEQLYGLKQDDFN
jgi:hypothetical protein